MSIFSRKKTISLENEQVLEEWKKMKNLLTNHKKTEKENREEIEKLFKGKSEGDKMVLTSMALAFTEGMFHAWEVGHSGESKKEVEEKLRYIG